MLRLLEVTKLQLNAEREISKTKDERLAAKDERIKALELQLTVKDQQLDLVKSASADRAQVNTGDARLLQRCDAQLAAADAEIFRLRHPGILRRLFSPDTLSAGVAGYGIGRATR